MVTGIGVDLVEIGRFRTEDDLSGFLRQILTEKEISEHGGLHADPALCARIFAAKEAVLKALGCGLAGGWSWRDVEITSDFRVVLSGGAGRLAQERSMRKIHIVQSCSGGYAMALAIAEA